MIALALLVVGVARPHIVQDVTRDEATIVLAIDTSRSMAATDVKPNRFAAAKAAAEAFLEEVPKEYSVGIVSFSTSANPVLPPTTDRDAGRAALSELRLGSGTAIGTAIERSVELALGQNDDRQLRRHRHRPRRASRRRPRCCCSSDGAQTAGDIRPLPAAQRARRLGVPVSTIALGTGDAVVEVPRPGGLKERVVVAPDIATLRLIAKTTGGTFSEAPSAAKLEAVYRELGTRLARDRKRVEVDVRLRRGRRHPAPARRARSRRSGSGGRCEARARVVARGRGGGRRRSRHTRGTSGRRVQGAAGLPARSRGHGSRSRRPNAAASRPVVWEMRCPLRGYIIAGLDARVSDRSIDVSIRGENGSPVSPGVTTGRAVVFTAHLHGRRAAGDVVPAVRRVHPDVGRRGPRRDGGAATSAFVPAKPIDRRVVREARLRRLRQGRRPVPGRDAPARRRARLSRSAATPSPARRCSARCASAAASRAQAVAAVATVAPSVPQSLAVELQLHALCTRVTR